MIFFKYTSVHVTKINTRKSSIIYPNPYNNYPSQYFTQSNNRAAAHQKGSIAIPRFDQHEHPFN